jgi:GT2 family glycosyltransferase
VRLLQHLVENTRSYPKWDLHIVYDGCTDASRTAAQEVLRDFPVPVYEYETPDVWEVKANNYGLTRAQGKYCVILQDDNFIYESGWLEKMLSWFEVHPKVGILGGLAGVNFFHLDSDPQGEGINRSTLEVHQRFDPAVNKDLRNYVFEVDAVMRGPIILRKELLEKYGYLDEIYAPLYNDDMDYCFRMRSLGYGVFCYPIDVVNESLTVAKYHDPAKDTFWKKTAEKNQKIFYERWGECLEQNHSFQLKVPRPTFTIFAELRPVDFFRTLKRSLPDMSASALRQRMRATSREVFLFIPVSVVRFVLVLLRAFGMRALAEKLAIHRFEPKTIPWRLANGETTLRLEYPLTRISIVYALGTPDTVWTEALQSRYGCIVLRTGEPPERESVDLLVLQMHGGEYELLERLIEADRVRTIKNIQVKFDDSVPDARARMRSIQKKLRETHSPTYQYEFVWENWERKD